MSTKVAYNEKIEAEVDVIRDNFKELYESGEDSWEQLEDSIGHTWNTLKSAVRDAVARIKKSDYP